MNPTSNPKLKPFAQKLRREMTKEERQKVIGPYIVDFYCASAKLVIELDGSQHFEEAGTAVDRARDEYLAGLGLHVVRYSNLDVNQNFSGVCEDILRRL